MRNSLKELGLTVVLTLRTVEAFVERRLDPIGAGSLVDLLLDPIGAGPGKDDTVDFCSSSSWTSTSTSVSSSSVE